MSPLSSRISERGVLNLPGTTYAAKRVTEDALLEDAQTHHCFFRAAGLHNHLSHQYAITSLFDYIFIFMQLFIILVS